MSKINWPYNGEIIYMMHIQTMGDRRIWQTLPIEMTPESINPEINKIDPTAQFYRLPGEPRIGQLNTQNSKYNQPCQSVIKNKFKEYNIVFQTEQFAAKMDCSE